MATWTVAIFATVFALVMAVLWIQLYGRGSPAMTALGLAFKEGWLMIVIALSVVWWNIFCILPLY